MNLASRLRGRVTVVGIGNPLRGDDGVGCRIVEALANDCCSGALRREAGLTVVNAEDVPENYLGPVVDSRPDVVLLVDAVDLGTSPGASVILESAALSGESPYTHRTSLRVTASLLERMTGAEVLLLAVQPGTLEWGFPLSDAVATSADSLTDLLREALAC